MPTYTSEHTEIAYRQPWLGHTFYYGDILECPICKQEVNTRHSGWVDKYTGNKYVHYVCLSQKRREEVTYGLHV